MTLAANRPIVTIFGANDAVDGDAAYQQAFAVGRTLGELGYNIANGGYGGTMEAAARGAAEAGGRAIGVTCSLWRSPPNKYISKAVNTADLFQRVSKLVELGSAGYVVLPGATGTLVEIALAWEMMLKKFLPRRPLVCMGAFWKPLIEMMAQSRPDSRDLITCIDSPERLAEVFPPAVKA